MIFSFVGSRIIVDNEEASKLFYNVAYRCASLGIGISSGGSSGADIIAETAYADAMKNVLVKKDVQINIYVPWKPFQGIRGINNPLHHLHILPSNPVLLKRAEEMVKRIHPAPNRLSQGAMKLHCRNMNQVFGLNLNSPIDACICWTPNGNIQGGTASHIQLCIENNIPVFNLGSPDKDLVLSNIRQFLLDNNIVGVK